MTCSRLVSPSSRPLFALPRRHQRSWSPSLWMTWTFSSKYGINLFNFSNTPLSYQISTPFFHSYRKTTPLTRQWFFWATVKKSSACSGKTFSIAKGSICQCSKSKLGFSLFPVQANQSHDGFGICLDKSALRTCPFLRWWWTWQESYQDQAYDEEPTDYN